MSPISAESRAVSSMSIRLPPSATPWSATSRAPGLCAQIAHAQPKLTRGRTGWNPGEAGWWRRRCAEIAAGEEAAVRSRLAANHRDAGDVVGLEGALGELGHALDDVLHHLACRPAAHLEDGLLEPLLAELRGRDIFGLRHPIGVDLGRGPERNNDTTRTVAEGVQTPKI